MMLEAMMAANDAMAIGPIETRLAKLASRLEKFNKAATLGLLSGLLTDPNLHANTVRLEVLLHLVALRSNGRLKPTAAQMREWLNEILGGDSVGRQEDPPEDVFIANVVSGDGNSLLFEGIWEANAGYVQAVLYAVTGCVRNGHKWADHCLRQSYALLRLSTAIAKRSGLSRYTIGGGERLNRIQFPTRHIEALAGRIRFSTADLADIGVQPFDLNPFIFDPAQSSRLRDEAISWSSLEARPVVKDGDDYVVVLPTAIGAAVRRRAMEMALGNGAGAAFQEHLTDYQFGNNVMSARIGLDLERIDGPNVDEASDCIEMTCRFDIGAYAHVIFVQDQVDAIVADGFRSINDVSTDVRRLAAAGVVAIEGRPDFRMGMTIVVFGGLGRGFSADPGRLPPKWKFVAFGCEDFELFGEDSNTSALQMYRLLDQEQQMLASRTGLFNPNGFLNLYGFAKSNDFELLPEDATPGRTMINLGTDYLTSVRTAVRQSLDHHGARVATRNSYVEVRRASTEMYFADLAAEPLYVSVADAAERRPAATIEIDHRTWWITVADPQPDSASSLSFRVWDMAKNWTVMIAPRVAAAAEDLPIFVGIELVFSEGIDLTPALIEEGQDLVRPSVSVDGASIRIDCPLDYLRAFGRPDNIGDRWMVAAISEGALQLAGCTGGTLAEEIASSILVDTTSRHLHVFTPRTAADFILATADLPRRRMLQPEVRAWVDIGLAQRSGLPAGTAGIIADKKTARELLGKAVETLWGEIQERLELLDRASIIEKCIDNHNAIDRDRATWRHTAAAVLRLHQRDEAMRVAVKLESDRAQVGLCCRVAVEMAVCASPETGGRECSLDDFDYVLAMIALLCGVASRSDEIYHGFSERVEVKPSGVLRFEDEFANRIQEPFMVALSTDQFDAAAEGYDTFYEVPEQIDDAEYERQSNPEFDAAFVAEYGVTPIRMVDFVSSLGERALASGNGRVTVRLSELKSDLVALDGVNALAAEALLDAWCLVPRSRWDDPKPDGASAKDWFPWRFARRLSLLSRPIIQLTTEDDPLCMVSPVIAQHGVDYAVRAYNARLPDSYFRSKEMRSWVGGAIDRLGHAFNHKVADRLKELGLQAEAEFLMTRLGGVAKDGDVDTLAWNSTTGHVFIIECKRLLADKTVGEIAERLVEFGPDHIERNGKRGPTRRHLDRVEILRGKLPHLATATGISQGAIKLRSCLVTSALVPMQFQREAAAYFDIVSDFDGLQDNFVCVS